MGSPATAGESRATLTIGDVLAHLKAEFPDLTISKIRFLETEGLVRPQRTPSGYRKFSSADVARLRFVLAAQRDHYLPLRVIKEHLEALDRGEPLPASVTGRVPVQPPAAPASPAGDGDELLSAEAFARAAGLEPEQLADCVQYGLFTPDRKGRHNAADLPVARVAAALARHGIEPRHLRAFGNAADREAGLIEQLVAPVLRARSEEARARATEKLRELAALSAQLHAALLEARLRDLLRP
jgi:DNA-binding transcriptional MerR regulator